MASRRCCDVHSKRLDAMHGQSGQPDDAVLVSPSRLGAAVEWSTALDAGTRSRLRM